VDPISQFAVRTGTTGHLDAIHALYRQVQAEDLLRSLTVPPREELDRWIDDLAAANVFSANHVIDAVMRFYRRAGFQPGGVQLFRPSDRG